MEEERLEKLKNDASLAAAAAQAESLFTKDGISPCCHKTMDLLAKNNPMMVCQDCKQMIKVFRSEPPFTNFVRFCHSRHRTIIAGKYRDLWVVTYQAFNSYGR